MVALKILVLVVGVRVLPGQRVWSLSLAARTGDSHSSNRGSIPLGTIFMPAACRLFFRHVWDVVSCASTKTNRVFSAFGSHRLGRILNPAEAFDA